MSQLIAMFCDLDDFCKWFEPNQANEPTNIPKPKLPVASRTGTSMTSPC